MEPNQKENDKRPHSLQTIYLNPPSRDSMDLIEGASQMLPPNNANQVVDARQQRQRWDAFFEPHYSFGSFVHGSKDSDHQKHLDQLVDDNCRIKSPRIEGPTLPGSVATSVRMSQDNQIITAAPTSTLPNFEMRNDKDKLLDEKSLIQRLELLKKIRTQGLEQQDNMSLASNQTTTARWKKQKMQKKLRDLPIDDDDQSSKSENGDEEEIKKKSNSTQNRPFLYFLLGFIFPPFWFLGAIPSTATRRSDRIWRRRSRIAFALFLTILIVFLIIALVLKPDTVGMRQSRPFDPNVSISEPEEKQLVNHSDLEDPEVEEVEEAEDAEEVED